MENMKPNVMQQKEISIWSLDISTRLRNILMRNGIQDLRQVTEFTKEDMLKFRNMGICTFEELESVCKEYEIKIWSMEPFLEAFKPYRFKTKVFRNMFSRSITSLQDFEDLSISEIAEIAEHKKRIVKRICEVLDKNGITYGN